MQKHPITKYRPFPVIDLSDRKWPSKRIERAPVWCSVDLRDGNQALAIPMSVKEKVELFLLLVEIGFKEIEIGFPSASDTEFAFARELVDRNLIPEDVTVQVLVQCREHLIRRTFEALQGTHKAIIHFYNSTNPLQRRVTFGLDRAQIKEIAVNGARLIRELAPTMTDCQLRYQYSPESFSDTELEFSLEVCEAVMDVMQPTPQNPIVLNLPATVEMATPNVHADQIEWFCRHLTRRDCAIVSLHTHNDRGTGVAATELGLMAGADRVEGTLFGNGERTGNVDIVTVALNMYTQGVDPRLNFGDIQRIREVYERCTRMSVHDRHPYGGDLVFTAFSGSHQDAINKGMHALSKEPGALWEVPYLPIDPEDIGRTYKAIIRINSQSGKGGVAYVLEQEYGYEMPKKMHPEFGAIVNRIADETGKELSSEEILQAFLREYVERTAPLELLDYDAVPSGKGDHHHIRCAASVKLEGTEHAINGQGNGPIAAFVNALENAGWKNFKLMDYRQHAVSAGSAAEAIAYILVERISDQKQFWGASIDANIEQAGLKALVSAFNRASLS
ncbi:MAG: 2-isopropylmalate synthase [Verrucomicrobia bacterium]|nr:2-isopropylmalate synthase [Verrucomicrobiota bacterium]